MVKQENFTTMKGHVIQGQKIKMRTGETLRIVGTLKSWKIVDEKERDVFINLFSAFEVENAIVNY